MNLLSCLDNLDINNLKGEIMGTANFCVDNASEHFVIGIDSDDYIDWDFEKDCLSETICEGMPAANGWGSYECDRRTIEHSGLRSYPRGYLASTNTITLDYAGVVIDFTIFAYVTSGYYEGATLDWTTDLHDDYDSIHEAVQDKIEDALYEEETNAGLIAIHGHKIESMLEKLINDEVKALEEIFRKVSQYRLHCVGRFSNGEAVYERVDA